MRTTSLPAVVAKTAIVHTVTYFVVGALAFLLLDYSSRYADPAVAGVLRQTSDPLVASGPLFQILRGVLFGLAFYPLRAIAFERANGWLVLWLVLLVVGIVAPFGAAPGSIEGMVYTTLPLWFHLMSLPEIVIQSLLLAFLSYYWINHPERRWLSWALVIVFALVVLLAGIGALAGFGLLPGPAQR